MKKKRVLVIIPHPDDAEYHAGGLIAKFISEGMEVLFLVATDGRCGSYSQAPFKLTKIRRQEGIEGANYLGAQVEYLNYMDYELDQAPVGELREKLVRKIREYQPEIVIAEDPFQKDQVHPDHRYLAYMVSDAINFSQLPNVFPKHLDEGLQPHYVIEKYLFTEDPLRVNKIVDVTEFVEKKLQAMKKHQSQVEFLVEDVLRQAKSAGLNEDIIPLGAQNDPFQLLAYAILTQMSEVGKTVGYQYGEGYRFSRFHPAIETILQNNHS